MKPRVYKRAKTPGNSRTTTTSNNKTKIQSHTEDWIGKENECERLHGMTEKD